MSIFLQQNDLQYNQKNENFPISFVYFTYCGFISRNILFFGIIFIFHVKFVPLTFSPQRGENVAIDTSLILHILHCYIFSLVPIFSSLARKINSSLILFKNSFKRF